MRASAAPLELRLGRSSGQALLLAGLTAAATLAPFASGLPVAAAAALAGAVLLAAGLTWRRTRRWQGAILTLWSDGRVALEAARDAGVVRAGRLADAVLLGPVVVLALALERGTQRVVLWSDAVDPDGWRRLRVLLRHRSEAFSDSVR